MANDESNRLEAVGDAHRSGAGILPATVSSESSAPPAPPAAPFAWQPLTPRGVAAFASATFGRLFLVQLIVALLAAGAIVCALRLAWFPSIREAIRQLPAQGVIRHGELGLPRAPAPPLAENRFLAITVNLENQRAASSIADVSVEFHKGNFQICSLLGCLAFDYPKSWQLEFNRPELEPRWGAWEPNIPWLAALAVVALLLLNWAALATLYFGCARAIAFYANRKLTAAGGWRLAGAALMPGALLLALGILGYGLGAVDLLRLGVLFALHFVVGWVYLFISPLCLPRLPEEAPLSANPFTAPTSAPVPKTAEQREA